MKPAKQKKCAVCPTRFVPSNTLQKVCGPRCALELVNRGKQKAKKAEIRKRKQSLKSRSDYEKDAQRDFNKWIRERDHGLPCISCGRYHRGQWHAGHYRTVGGNPELRFEPLNCHRQCAPCNNHKSGDIVNYRISLIARIGEAAVAWLEGPHAPKKYSVEQLIEIASHYRAKARELRKARESGLGDGARMGMAEKRSTVPGRDMGAAERY